LNKNRRAITLGVAMCATSATSFALRPGPVDRSKPPPITLKTAIPEQFGEWVKPANQPIQVSDPATVALLEKIYGQVLTRNYVSRDGYGIMLSVAYGADQTGGLTAHKPEVCYPAQGFKLEAMSKGPLTTPLGAVDVVRLQTSLRERYEPVTYWFTQGDQVVKDQFDRRVAQIKAYLTGQIPDGILFRVSSIDRSPQNAFARQQQFVADLVPLLKPEDLRRLTGLAPATAA
jgi:EpsI family protein